MSHTIRQPSEATTLPSAADVPYPAAKQVFDKTVPAVMVVALSPLFLLALGLMAADMLLHRENRGRWLYRERRISRGREFDVLKFRVLREDVLAEVGRKGEYARLYEADHGNLTGAGRIVKRVYADELPQLFNILRGDISMVGPRPWPLPMVREQVANGLDYRMHVMAGWTGPAQVRKDSRAKAKAVPLDLEYVELCKTLSGARLVWHDLKVLRESVRTVLRGRGLKY